jgi:hypothetical protein
LKWFSAIAQNIFRPKMETHLKPILEIIYRITTDETTRGDDHGNLHNSKLIDSLRNLAKEAQAHLQVTCDPQIYLAIYSQVKESAIKMRNERKVERSVMVAFSMFLIIRQSLIPKSTLRGRHRKTSSREPKRSAKSKNTQKTKSKTRCL